jgi:hypothetical protein
MLDLRWSTEETGKILANKISSFFGRTYEKIPPTKTVFDLVFKQPFHWGTARLEAFRPIHILSAGRPRWATQLCRLAARDAYKKHLDRIANHNISACLKEYGQSRLADLYKEHHHQCPQLELLIEAFAGSSTQYETRELLAKLQSQIVDKYGVPQIDGIVSGEGALAISHFLYRIGFLNARDERTRSGPLEFIRFEERPHLLSSIQNPDDGLKWEIHPSYRTVLRIDSDTFRLRRQTRVRKS